MDLSALGQRGGELAAAPADGLSTSALRMSKRNRLVCSALAGESVVVLALLTPRREHTLRSPEVRHCSYP
jgi:hypothetical protein